jgi:hypothetical protein
MPAHSSVITLLRQNIFPYIYASLKDIAETICCFKIELMLLLTVDIPYKVENPVQVVTSDKRFSPSPFLVKTCMEGFRVQFKKNSTKYIKLAQKMSGTEISFRYLLSSRLICRLGSNFPKPETIKLQKSFRNLKKVPPSTNFIIFCF